MDLAQPADVAAVEEHPLRRCRLARVNVRHDTNVADLAAHKKSAGEEGEDFF